jgi:hypothetical protein
MSNMSEFEKEYYKQEGLYEIMDPNKFYADIEDYVEDVQKQTE